MIRKLISIALLAAFVTPLAYGHGGRLDKNGGHRNRKTGGYHCHRCPCGCSDATNKAVDPSTPMRLRPKSSGAATKPGGQTAASLPAGKHQRTVTRVVDGDTIVLDGGEKVRLIGVDTPETVHPKKPVEFYGREASAFLKKLIQGKQILVEYGNGGKDKYGRSLAYLYTTDGLFINAEIVKQGYGHAYTRFPFKYMEQFRQLEREAKKAKRGLWGR